MNTAGSLWLQDHLQLKGFILTHRSYLGSNDKIELLANGEVSQIYSAKYAPKNNSSLEHLAFSLKYDDLNLAFLKAAFNKIPEAEIVSYLVSSPSGKYARRIGFLYEFLTTKQLAIHWAITGNYIDLLENEKYITAKAIKNSRWRINDNLLGTVDFCPIVRRTNTLNGLLQSNIKEQIEQLKQHYSPDIFRRASNYLYSKETRSSYEIEREKPSPERIERFMALLAKAGSEDHAELLSEKSLTRLQNAIVDPRFAAERFRDFQNYIGQSLLNFLEHIHYLCPPPQYLPSLMDGLKACADKTTDTSGVARAAIIAFGFVFIHPFEDGNGRLHRFLIHDTLVRAGMVPQGFIIPVSAHMLNHMTAYDQALESYSRPLMQQVQYKKEDTGEIEIVNPAEVESYFRYPDLTIQSIFLAQTIQATLIQDMPDELAFIQRYDEVKGEFQNRVDMPDKEINRMIIFLHQNKGVFPKRRRKDFPKLTEDEIADMEKSYREIFELGPKTEL